MTRWIAILALCFSFLARAEDWQPKITPPTPGEHPLPRSQKLRYTFGWSALTAAQADVDFRRTKDGRLVLDGKVKTVGAARALWRIDAQHLAVALPENLRPIDATQTEAYKSKTVTTKLTFVPEGVERFRTEKPAGKDDGKTKRFKFPKAFDLHTALLFIRSQPLRNGEVYRLAVYPAASPYFTEIEVVGREKIKVAGKQWDSVKLKIKLREINKKLELETHKKFKNAHAWLSDDADRLLIKVDSEVFIGKVWMELEKVEFTEEQAKPGRS